MRLIQGGAQGVAHSLIVSCSPSRRVHNCAQRLQAIARLEAQPRCVVLTEHPDHEVQAATEAFTSGT